MFPSAAILSLMLAAAAAPSGPQDGAAPAPAAKPEPEKKVCVSETPTGSIMSQRVCHTKAEWGAIRARDQQSTDQFLAGSRQTYAPRGN